MFTHQNNKQELFSQMNVIKSIYQNLPSEKGYNFDQASYILGLKFTNETLTCEHFSKIPKHFVKCKLFNVAKNVHMLLFDLRS